MFCAQCGAHCQADDRFCSSCGAPLRASVPGPQPEAPAQGSPADWSEIVDYRVLTAIPEVHDRVAHAAAQASAPMSAADFLAVADKAIAPLVSSTVSTESIMQLVQPIYERMGMQTGKTQTEEVPWPTGRVIVAVLCSCARRSMTIGAVHQGADGVVIEATLPSSALAMKSTLVATIARSSPGTSVQAAAATKGQLYDWGRSKRTLQTLFEDVAALAAPDIVG